MTTSKAALNFPSDYALAIATWGQSNARPRGDRDTEGYAASPHLALRAAGKDLTVLGISGNYVLVSETLTASDYRLGGFRLMQTVYGSSLSVEARVGFGTVRENTAQLLTVDWAATASPAALDATVTFTIGTPGLVNLATHGLASTAAVAFNANGGVLPTGLREGVVYYVTTTALNTFSVSETSGGSSINFTDAGSGTLKMVYSDVLTVTFGAGTSIVTLVAHGLQAGNRVVFSDGTGSSTLPASLAFGQVYYVVSVPTADTFSVATSRNGTAIAFATAGTGTVKMRRRFGSYATLNDRFKSYANVKVLTPYQPEAAGGYPATAPSVPGTLAPFPAAVATYEDAALFLDFSWNEGVEGVGTYNDSLTGSGASGSTVAGLVLTCFSSVFSANLYVGGYVQITDAAGSRWVGKIASNTSSALTVESWTPASGSTTAPTGNVAFEAHIPHWLDSPYHALPGIGFRYPSNDHSPQLIYNRPRGVLTQGYGVPTTSAPKYRFGYMIELAWRLSLMLGRTIYVVNLGVDAAGLSLSTANNSAAFQGQLGWADDDVMLSWTPGSPTSLAARFARMLTVQAPAALTAAGSPLKLRYIGISGFQGETDAGSAVARENYRKSLPAFYAWLRNLIVDAGLSAFSGDVRVPVVHARITHEPWEVSSIALPFPPYVYPVANPDLLGLVNAAVEEFVARDGYADTIDTDDSQKLVYSGFDPLHFNGIGEARNGRLVADAMYALVCRAAAQGIDLSAVEISNLALSLCGQESLLISLDPAVDQSHLAALCARFYPTARDLVSERHSWSFTTKHCVLTEITKDLSRTEWAHAYAIPANMAKPISVLPANAGADYMIEMTTPTTLAELATVATQGKVTLPRPFTIENDAEGLPVLYTNEPDAVLRYNLRLDGSIGLPKQFKLAVAWQLASFLAGSLMKGDVGMNFAIKAEAMSKHFGGAAAVTDSAHREQPQQSTLMPWNR